VDPRHESVRITAPVAGGGRAVQGAVRLAVAARQGAAGELGVGQVRYDRGVGEVRRAAAVGRDRVDGGPDVDRDLVAVELDGSAALAGQQAENVTAI
jgi:hypothetical protein